MTNRAFRRSIVAAALVLTVSAIAVVCFRKAGAWLLVEDPLRSAQAAVVLGGQVPFRAMEAAAVYKQGLVQEVWVTRGVSSDADETLARLDIERPPESMYSVKVLERLGVPDTAIRVLEPRVSNTADELRAIAAHGHRVDRVILVTSGYHTRRVRLLWRTLVGGHPQAIVRRAPDDPFDADRWWQRTADAMAVSREWLGIVNASLGLVAGPAMN